MPEAEPVTIPDASICEGCIMRGGEVKSRLPEVARGYLRFNKTVFVQECTEKLSDDLEGDDRFEACGQRAVQKVLDLQRARGTIRRARLIKRGKLGKF